MIAMKDIAALPDWFKSTRAGKEMLDQAAAQIDGQRKHALEVIKTYQREAAETLPELAKAREAAKAALQKAKQHVAECQRALTLAEIAELDASNRIEAAVAPSRSFLQETAPECVSDFLRELLQFYSDIRRSNVVLPELKPDDVIGNMTLGAEQRKRIDERWQHTLIVREFHSLVRETIEAVKSMFLTVVSAEEAAKQIARYRAALAKGQKAAGMILN